ncbi:deoxynucleoside triphosphate triphosphohydrolase SAMHD1-like [Watersipora subatra]|uniref:deoxynucleoside triphosphate triphosphohydrolase SAMHD1-like n=1 Tax=Watersipora subatra TaxID=2589382 RepID=UPI00355B7419
MTDKNNGLRRVIIEAGKEQEWNLPESLLKQFESLESLTFLDYPLLSKEKLNDAVIDNLLRKVCEHLKENNFVIRDYHKLINDPIHGTVYLHPVALVMMSTPQFQRLHYIKQLSTKYYVYPSASYSRFEHSVGTYHLAGKLINTIKDQQPELKISAIDAMCVQLAGLCHDLGHGPFSHMFDKVTKTLDISDWSHEMASTKMVDLIWEKKKKEFTMWGFTEENKEFIKSLIKPNLNEILPERSYLYEIVSNCESGMDVDKWDYLVRDSFHLGIKCGFDPYRLIYHQRVLSVGKERKICYRDKEANTISSMFHTRFDLHQKACQHRVVVGIELQVAEALQKAASSGALTVDKKSLIQCLEDRDMEAYTHLDDGIFSKILESEGEALNESRDLLQHLQERQIWKFVAEARIEAMIDLGEGVHSEEFDEILRRLTENCQRQFRWAETDMNFGKKDKNPLDYIWFYSKESSNPPFLLKDKGKRLYILPKEFQHRTADFD